MRKVRNFPRNVTVTLLHKSVSVGTLFKLMSPNKTLCEMKVAFPLASIMFHVHTAHFLEGVNLTGGIPFVWSAGSSWE